MRINLSEYCDLVTSKIILETSIEILKKGDVPVFFETLSEKLKSFLNFDGWTVVGILENKPKFIAYSKHYERLNFEKIEEKMSNREKFIYMQVKSKRRWRYIKNLQKEEIWIPRGNILSSWIGIPLIFKDIDVYTILNLEYFTPKKLTTKNKIFLDHFQKNFFVYASKFLDIKALFDQKYIDPLTGLKNRFYLEKVFSEIDNSEKIGIIFCDLDGFKNINDKYGHKFGDEVLKIASKRIKNIVKSTDDVIRYGGDEFVVLTKNTEGVNKIINRIKQFVSKREISIDNQVVNIGISCGYAIFPDETNNLQEALNISDMRMYKEKEKNKNIYKRR
ncbi:GGDEF domain-containing protein [Thermosipho atlanticus]|uniref:GGDEF domain-containing protein n=1 Tax=Thermosipho atlanticus TaxID=238991 RepID=UPI001F445D3D|nr:GGDEF domain-containing protein [Thermosipho atlanticus]